MSLKNKFNISLFSIIIIFLVDRISKFYIITLSKKNFNQEIFQSEYLNLVLIWNDGIAFGLLSLQESYLYNLITLLIGFIILVLIYLIYKSQNFKKFSYILVTGGAGFIGSAVIRYLINTIGCFVLNVDKLTYAGNLNSLKNVISNPKYSFEKLDICDVQKLDKAVKEYKPNIIMHLAAESHVDRSIDGPSDFIQTNIVGTYSLLEVSRGFWSQLDENEKAQFRFHHISTDEVFGSLGLHGAFTETTRYDPRSPYSASKASADHLVRAWHETFGLPVVLSNCSNNYGPYHFPEKLIPLMIIKALKGEAMPVYGAGNNVRDWLYVDDHARALYEIASKGRPGESYNVGGNSEVSNIEVVKTICTILDELAKKKW